MPNWWGKNPSRNDPEYYAPRPHGRRGDMYGQKPHEIDQGKMAARNMRRNLSPLEQALLKFEQRWGRFFR